MGDSPHGGMDVASKTNQTLGRTRIAWVVGLLHLGTAIDADQHAPEQISLWPNGAPGFESRRAEPEMARDYWVKNIHNPSITVFLPPPEKATGAAVVICPGGGHRELVFKAEGQEAAEFFNSVGVAAFALKYRLAREENSPYSLPKHPREDAYRALRIVRSRAREWNVDPKRVGVMGFSAGGEVASFVSYGSGRGNPKADDPIDHLNGRPDFQILVYPGPLAVPKEVPPDAPPAFLFVAGDDHCCVGPVVSLLQKYREAKAPVEAHIVMKGGHGFNMGHRAQLRSLKTWPQRVADWMSDAGLLNPLAVETSR
jgi:acetyl esterase/lipase